MDCNTPGFPVHHQLPELAQTHVHRVCDAIQPSHPLLSPFSSCLQSFQASGSFPMSQFFASGGPSIRVSASASVLPMNIQDGFPLGQTVWSPCRLTNSSRLNIQTWACKDLTCSLQRPCSENIHQNIYKKYNVSLWILHEKSRLYYTIKDNPNINIINTQ